MKTKTLEELGQSLPILSDDGSRPTFSFKPWRFKEEMRIGQIKKQYKHFGRFVREVFDFMLVRFNEKEWESYSSSEKKILLNQLPLGSVMYMYFYLRYEALGEELQMTSLSCPQCNTNIEGLVASLNELDVKIQEKEDPSETLYSLKKPFNLGEIQVDGIKFKYTPWDAMEKLSLQNASNEAAIKKSMLQESITKAHCEEVGETELDKIKLLEGLSKRDIEGAYDFLDSHNGGPVMGLEITCPSCSYELKAPIQWDYAYFFSNSSVSGSQLHFGKNNSH